MAIIDAYTMLSGGVSTTGAITYQTVTGASSVLSTNTLDLLHNQDYGMGESPTVQFEVGTAFTGLTALEMQVITADDAALTTNVTVIGGTGAIPVASLTAGARFYVDVSGRPGNKGQRYVGARYIPTGTGTAGTISAAIVGDVQDSKKLYPSSYSVL